MVGNSDKFNSLSDLYKRILPALEAKVSELKRDGFRYIESLDIWNYCIETKWKNRNNLRIYEMVDDIFNVDNVILDSYVRQNMINQKKINDKGE